jgi:ribosomal protein L11 methyltransferase
VLPRVRRYPALDIATGDPDLLLAIVDDFSPTAVEERHDIVRVFFKSAESRDLARAALAPRFAVHAIDVSDEDWARRSQANLQPVTVGRITIVPDAQSLASSAQPRQIQIVIRPSMGFGTGHHATTRLCVAALQTIDLTGKVVLDVGTGSGVLAIAADRLGAASAVGIDVDADAIQSARENLSLNPAAERVRFEVADLTSAALPAADVLLANLTGALLQRSAPALVAAVKPGGIMILSGLQAHERDDVVRAFAAAETVWERDEESWVGLAMKKW